MKLILLFGSALAIIFYRNLLTEIFEGEMIGGGIDWVLLMLHLSVFDYWVVLWETQA